VSKLATHDYESAARNCAGNWREFDTFVWHDAPDDNPQEWGIVYTHNRDSGIEARCNGESIAEALAPFIESGDVLPEHHGHYLCGWVDGFAIRIYHDGEITEAFRIYCDLLDKMDDYPILDESRLGRMEQEESASAWDDWARHDFVKALEKRFGVDTLPTIDAKQIKKLFDDTCGAACEYWFSDGRGMTVRMDKITQAVELENALPFLDTTVSPETERIATTLMEAIDALPVAGLIYAGAGFCGNLGGIPDMSNGIAPQDADDLFRVLFYFKTQYACVVESTGVVEPALSKALCDLDRIARMIDA
jgi:hypothetical protein